MTGKYPMTQEDILIFLRPVSPVVGMFIPRPEGNEKESDITGNNKFISGHALNHGTINTEVIFFSSLTGIVLKTTDNMDFRNSRLGIEEKLWAETDTVTYGLFRRVVKKFNRLFIIRFRGKGNKPAFGVLIQGYVR
ncbi:hypothetical protein D6S17_26705 [Salmonella enterica subsp. enterica serovar Java]|uniref:Uncharacterized protein n=1 Tax=Salmonella enterica subsp. enterica serovar Java TaxID=224729 RepID=A0A3Z6QQ94_SALEB|nr:hypothetical protein [Salmonella enterica subsp. enterica serovar Java]EAN9728944.1 hypothetical protein [Salmonella enterica]EBW9699286.1 hypothetical protein [Salmonella enterica subsp. enterica serovar Oranienburg]EAC0789118.1 hypothetical protein [Salmonella enterica subsp. enterica serovar Java]EAP7757698.1 hypothetical protein [Salmonella enterica]